MLTVLELLLKSLIELLPKYQSDKIGRERRDFGKKLVILYFRLVDIVALGRRIVDQIQVQYNWYYVGQDKPFRTSPQGTKYWNENLSRLLYSQGNNLNKLEEELAHVLHVMQVLLPANEIGFLSGLIYGKRTIIRSLAHLLNTGKLPADSYGEFPKGEDDLVFSDDINALGKVLNSSTPDPKKFGLITEKLGISYIPNIEIEVGVLEITNQNTETDVDKLVKIYLQSEPYKRLDTLEKYTEQLRTMIKENFDLDEILWTITKASKEHRL